MLNVFTLASSINESTINSDLMLGEAYDFAGNVNDASYDFAYLAMQESVDAAHYDASVNEIMVEAAIGNPQSMEALSEASLKDIWGKIKAFFKRIWEWVKGLISKIINYIKATIAKTKAYKNSVTKRAEKLIKDGKSKSVKVMAYEYDYNMVADIDKKVGIIYKKHANNIANTVDDAMQKSSIAPSDSNKAEDIIDEFKKKTENAKELRKNNKSKEAGIPVELNDAFSAGCTGDFRISDVYTAIVAKYRGEKKEMTKSASEVKDLVDDLDKYTKLLEDGTKTLKEYEKQLKDINTRLARVKGTGDFNTNLRDTQDQVDAKGVEKAKIQAAATAYMNALYSEATNTTAAINNMLSGANSALRTLCNGMIANNMSIINRVLGGKDAKAKKE